MPSFDVVCKTNLMEVDNAIHGMQREIKQRFDLKGTSCDIERTDNTLTVTAENTMQLTQLEDLLRKYLSRRNVDQGAVELNQTQNAAGGTIRRTISIRQGIEQDLSRKIIKAIKATKTKVQLSIQGNEIHVSGKKRDDLQETITFIQSMEIEQPLQYVNFRD
ncbi:MAG: YajQ family cyclic di-GMP-binding protein [Dehalococcoidia bacterium]|nr:YajQ family cyclic di-GMP-binding protein [Dehalococcoidia bacterium]